jgi:hypothetical protein
VRLNALGRLKIVIDLVRVRNPRPSGEDGEDGEIIDKQNIFQCKWRVYTSDIYLLCCTYLLPMDFDVQANTKSLFSLLDFKTPT